MLGVEPRSCDFVHRDEPALKGGGTRGGDAAPLEVLECSDRTVCRHDEDGADRTIDIRAPGNPSCGDLLEAERVKAHRVSARENQKGIGLELDALEIRPSREFEGSHLVLRELRTQCFDKRHEAVHIKIGLERIDQPDRDDRTLRGRLAPNDSLGFTGCNRSLAPCRYCERKPEHHAERSEESPQTKRWSALGHAGRCER